MAFLCIAISIYNLITYQYYYGQTDISCFICWLLWSWWRFDNYWSHHGKYCQTARVHTIALDDGVKFELTIIRDNGWKPVYEPKSIDRVNKIEQIKPNRTQPNRTVQNRTEQNRYMINRRKAYGWIWSVEVKHDIQLSEIEREKYDK